MTPSASRHGGTQLDREAMWLILFCWEAGAISANVAAAALNMTHAELFELEESAAAQGAKLAKDTIRILSDASAEIDTIEAEK